MRIQYSYQLGIFIPYHSSPSFHYPKIFYDASQKPHTESSEQDRVPVIQTYNKDTQQDSQSHTQHVYDAAYPAMLVTIASGLLSK
jgi:hypothetical protein